MVVAWHSSEDPDGALSDVFAQRIGANGAERGAPFRVNTATEGVQNDADVGVDAAGNFVIAWQNDVNRLPGGAVRVRRYNAAGTPQGDEVALEVARGAELPAVAVAPDGSYVITWDVRDANGPVQDAQGQRFNAAGVPQGPYPDRVRHGDNGRPVAGLAVSLTGSRLAGRS